MEENWVKILMELEEIEQRLKEMEESKNNQ